ncbi:N-acyl-D-amino-acid deacylase family protein [Halarsenatibacter silvermanii]|uniref:N-acyl-D-amino-acid deacylase n=1 Tax=Halarsenatibacter silvermanii TaxID=321763 RepID=A0A1G9IMJ2_9FIRM|nr:D-aminoacylase [Halarsenatibacter silvermanii]SDL26381.1 N-acyl-D-amino-acid deacylase [Halarsenatibacter silvermanii]
MYDTIIKNGRIYDGTGSEPYEADLALKDGHIVRIAPELDGEAEQIISAEGEAVTPGFIDTHGHSDIISWAMENYDYKIRQGVTTEVMGSCGLSAAPCREKHKKLLDEYIDTIKCGQEFEWRWGNFSEYLNFLDQQTFPNNLVPLIGHGTIRISRMGFADASPDEKQLADMKEILERSLTAGAFGLSAGLVYPPGAYSGIDELAALNEVVSEGAGIFSIHMRNEGSQLLEAIEEVIEIVQRTDVTALISHLKSMGRPNWGESPRAIEMIKKAREDGLSIWADQYPYTANSTFLNALIPPEEMNRGLSELLTRLRDDDYARNLIERLETEDESDWENFLASADGWENILVLSLPQTPEWNGCRIDEIAEKTERSPGQVFIDLMIKNKGRGLVVAFTLSEDDVKSIMKASFQMFGSDGLPGESGGHPRIYGTFPRVYDRYAGGKKPLDITEAVRKMTGLPAQVLGLEDRGELKEGMRADINILDLSRFRDRATYQEPLKAPAGVKYVLLGGDIVVKDDEVIKKDCGRLLRK